MHTFIESADDIIALTISTRIEAADLDAVLDRLDAAMAKHDRIHVFVETVSLESIEVPALATHTARAMPLLAALHRFGRVAVVADQAWVRAGTRLESAMLPFVSYRVYMPAQRDEALAWVSGQDGG